MCARRKPLLCRLRGVRAMSFCLERATRFRRCRPAERKTVSGRGGRHGETIGRENMRRPAADIPLARRTNSLSRDPCRQRKVRRLWCTLVGSEFGRSRAVEKQAAQTDVERGSGKFDICLGGDRRWLAHLCGQVYLAGRARSLTLRLTSRRLPQMLGPQINLAHGAKRMAKTGL